MRAFRPSSRFPDEQSSPGRAAGRGRGRRCRRRLLVWRDSGRSSPAAQAGTGRARPTGGAAAANAAKDERAVAVEVTRVGVVQLPADHHGGRQPALGRVGHPCAPKIAGRITEILFQEGKPVTKGETAGAAGPVDQRRRGAPGARQPDAGQGQVRTLGGPGGAQFHLRAGQGRGAEQPRDRRLGAGAGGSQAAQDGAEGALLRDHRPAGGVGRRLRARRRGPGEPAGHRSAQGRFPGAGELPEAGPGRPVGGGHAGCAAGQDLRRQGVRARSPGGRGRAAPSSSARRSATRTRRCDPACSPASR